MKAKTFSLAVCILFLAAGAHAQSASYSYQTILKGNISYFDISASNPAVMYAGNSASGVYKTTDAGDSWNKVYAKKFIALAVDKTSSDAAYAIEGG